MLVVNLPAEARLTIDDSPTRSTSSVRTFISPPLSRGKEYSYTLKAELPGGGTLTKAVTVRAGEQANVRFDFASNQVARK